MPPKILIRGVNWLGDAVMSLPAILSLVKQFPEVHILSSVKINDLYKFVPDIKRVITFSVKGLNGGASRLRLSRDLRKENYTHAIIFPNSFDSALVPFMAGIPERIGFATQLRSLLLTCKVSPPQDYFSAHHSLHYLKIIEEAGFNIPQYSIPDKLITVPISNLSFLFKKLKEWTGKDFCKNYSFYAVCTGAEFGPAKKWPVEYYKQICQRISKETTSHVFLLGTGRDKVDGDFIAEDIPNIFNLCGKTTLSEFITLLSCSKGLLCNDSGSMHLGGALGIPVIAIFGSTSPKATKGLGKVEVFHKALDCSPCLQRTCKKQTYQCLTDIRPEYVWESVRKWPGLNNIQ